MKIKVINVCSENDIHTVTYKYWNEEECACKAIKIKRVFNKIPTESELIDKI